MATPRKTPPPANVPEPAAEDVNEPTPEVEPETEQRPPWETVPGGRYRDSQGVLINAHGQLIDENGTVIQQH